MARFSYVMREGRLWERGTEPPLPRGPRSALPCPSIRTDAMAPITSMADGLTYDSKGRYYASLKAHGAEIVGDDFKPFEKPRHTELPGVGDTMRAVINGEIT